MCTCMYQITELTLCISFISFVFFYSLMGVLIGCFLAIDVVRFSLVHKLTYVDFPNPSGLFLLPKRQAAHTVHTGIRRPLLHYYFFIIIIFSSQLVFYSTLESTAYKTKRSQWILTRKILSYHPPHHRHPFYL